jgi:hypothetical protein
LTVAVRGKIAQVVGAFALGELVLSLVEVAFAFV